MSAIADPIARAAGLACWSGPVAPEPLAGGITNKNFLVRDRRPRGDVTEIFLDFFLGSFCVDVAG